MLKENNTIDGSIIDLRSSELAKEQQKRLEKEWNEHEAGLEKDEIVEDGKIEDINEFDKVDGEVVVEKKDDFIISPDVLSAFKDSFKINPEDLKTIEGFDDLSDDQQSLVAENLKQLTFGRVQEEAIKEHKEGVKESGFLGKIWKGITKNYRIAKFEKISANEIEKGGIEIHKDILQELASGMNAFGPEVKRNKGKLEIQFAGSSKELSDVDKKMVDDFNGIANEFARVSSEAGVNDSGASRKEKGKYVSLKNEYEKAKQGLLNVKTKGADEGGACFDVNQIDYQVQMNQFLNTHPDVENALKNIKDQKLWYKALKNTVSEKGVYLASGFAARTATTGIMATITGAIAAPVGAMAAGGLVGRMRAKKELKEKDTEARKGGENLGETAKKYSEVKNITNKIDKIYNKLQNGEELTEKKKAAYERALKVSVDWIEDKKDKGMINFGTRSNRIKRQYDLMQSLGKAKSIADLYEFKSFSDKSAVKNIDDLNKRVAKSIDNRDEKAQKERGIYTNKKMMQGVLLGGSFAYAGREIADYFNIDVGGSVKKGFSNMKEYVLGEDVKFAQPEVKTFKVSLPEEIKDTELGKEPLAEAEKAPIESPKAETEVSGVEDAPIQEPVKGAPKKVIEELKETVKKQEAIKDIAAKVAEQEVAMPEHGVKNNFKIKLGENEVPAHLERTMYAFAMDAMDEKEMYTDIKKSGVKLFDEEPAARSLNVAANLTKMAEGELSKIKGVDINNDMRNSFNFNKETGELEITNHGEFNNLVKNLHVHAKKLWNNEILQKEAVGYLDRIDRGTYQDIIKANGLEDQVDGHDDLDVKIKDFENSEMVQKAEEVIRAREARESARAEIPQVEKSQTKAPYKIFEAKFESPERYLNNFLSLSEERVNGAAIIHEELSAYDSKFKKQLLSQVEKLTGSDLSEKSIGDQANLINLKTALTVDEITKGYSEINQIEHIKFIREHYHLYKDDSITEIYKQMPDSIRGNGEQALNYLKISTGNDDEVSSGFKGMLNLDYKPQSDVPYGFSKDLKTGILTLHDVGKKEGTSVLIDFKNNKIGAQEIGMFGRSFGTERKFFRFGKAEPIADLTMKNLKGVKEFLGVSANEQEAITQGFEAGDNEGKKGFIAE
ncbi:hypothetical protein KAI65_00665 [Candidatus Parcubacteria bacterium]|nr:hypothetical protein [Candidatus Parcubacteria bacterium]